MLKVIKKTTRAKAASVILMSCFATSFLLSILHNHELAYDCLNCHNQIKGFVQSNHILPADLKAFSSGEHRRQHDARSCPICIFNKYLAGVKYFPPAPCWQNSFVFITKQAAFNHPAKSKITFLLQNPRAPPA